MWAEHIQEKTGKETMSLLALYLEYITVVILMKILHMVTLWVAPDAD